jgi:hypothetical protein
VTDQPTDPIREYVSGKIARSILLSPFPVKWPGQP